jgi:endonuclease G, mitochondrial
LLDPCWGDQVGDAKRGQEDTFHFTNAAPQFQRYNDSDWGNLEDYLLDKAQGTEKKLTVFTGPIYLPDDPFYGYERKAGPWQIPLSFWKVAILQKSNTKIAAAAFIVGQTEYVQALYETKVFSGLKPYTVADPVRSEKRFRRIASLFFRAPGREPQASSFARPRAETSRA